MSKKPRFYWCVKTDLSQDGEIYFHACEIEVNSHGDMIGWRLDDDGKRKHQTLAISAGNWSTFFSASCMDGGATCVEHWAGEYNSSTPAGMKGTADVLGAFDTVMTLEPQA